MFAKLHSRRCSAFHILLQVDNAFDIGGSSLLMGALAIAPSKDTLWTASPQPGTMSDTEHSGNSYTTQPHVALDVVLATLSLGPVGISDGLGQQDVGLISQAFMSATDGTLLRPSRPLSWVDSVWFNRSAAGGNAAASQDIRSTHSAIPTSNAPSAPVTAAWHSIVAWRTTSDVELGATDLFPLQRVGSRVAVRAHVLSPSQQQAGCVDAQPNSAQCAVIVAAGQPVAIPHTGTAADAFSLTSVAVELDNGAFFLGELSKLVHVSPQRFTYVRVGGSGPSKIVAGVRGTAGQAVLLTSIDSLGVVHVVNVTIPAGGVTDVNL